MPSRLRGCVASLVWLLIGCTAEQAAKPGVEKDAKSAEPEAPAKPEPALPEVDTAAPPEPEPPPEPALPEAGEGFELGPKPEAYAGDEVSESKPLQHAGATVSVTPGVIPPSDPDGERTVQIQARVEFEGASVGLNHVRTMAGSYCDQLVPEVQEIAKLDDGRWLVSAQLACRAGEDYFSADNEHTLIVVDPPARTAKVLWTGSDSGSNAMGVCVESSVHAFEVGGDALIIRKTEVTELDTEAAKELEAAAEGCVAKPETTTEVERISLARGK